MVYRRTKYEGSQTQTIPTEKIRKDNADVQTEKEKRNQNASENHFPHPTVTLKKSRSGFRVINHKTERSRNDSTEIVADHSPKDLSNINPRLIPQVAKCII